MVLESSPCHIWFFVVAWTGRGVGVYGCGHVEFEIPVSVQAVGGGAPTDRDRDHQVRTEI